MRTLINEQALNEKVMALICARPSGADARSVFLELIHDPKVAYNWRIGHFDPGRGDRYQCKLSLRAIHETLREEFDMSGES